MLPSLIPGKYFCQLFVDRFFADQNVQGTHNSKWNTATLWTTLNSLQISCWKWTMERSLLASFPISEGDLENNYFKLLFLMAQERKQKTNSTSIQHDWFCPSYLLLYISIYQQGPIPPIAILHYCSVLVYISPAKMLWCFSERIH